MDAKSARTANIRSFVSAAGGPTTFANRYGDAGPSRSVWSQAQVSQWISVEHPKGIGHALAREIERRLGLSPGWMDHDHAADRSVDMTATGAHASATISPDDRAILDLYHAMTPDRKAAWAAAGRAFAESPLKRTARKSADDKA